MLTLAPSRLLSKPILAIACLGLTFLLLSLTLVSHEDGREYVLGVVQKVGKGLSVKGSNGAVIGGEHQMQDAMREWELRRALQHEGTGSRIQAFLDKARAGQGFTVAAVGGSVSKGRGLTPPRASKRPSSRANSPRSPEDASSDDKLEDNIDITDAPPASDDAIPAEAESDPDSSEESKEGSHPISPLAHLGASTLYSPENLHVQIFEWLDRAFPSRNPERKNRFVNGAQGGVGAAYFGWCFKEHIPEEVDLVLLELGINDLLEFDVVSQYEHLVRGILEQDSKPAVINIETFTTLFPSLISSSTFHHDVLSFYDVPSLSIRDVIIPRLVADPEHQMSRWFRTGDDVALGDAKVREWGGVPVDVMHISAIGHSLAAGLVIRYLQDQIDKSAPLGFSALGRFAETISRKPILRVIDVPPTTLTGQFNPFKADLRHAPVCRSQNSGKVHGKWSSLVDDFGDGSAKGLVLADGSHGWSEWSWKEKRYLIARTPGSLAKFEFTISPPQSVPHTEDPSAALLLAEEEFYEHDPGEGEGEEEDDPLPLAARPGGPYNPDAAHHSRRSRAPSSFSPHHARHSPIPHGKRHLSSPNARQNPQAGGSILIGYQRSAKLGLGSVYCWVDGDREDEKGKRVDGWWKLDKRNMGMVSEIRSGLEPGRHTLACEVLEETLDPAGGTEFRLFAVMHD
ncbi:hypothetical protein I350_02792 [Cryptococcus amylolentus CBS 6273]|uniref:SGNH hydrolase-type esterase domain-containing protein n=1 Tax=Cryptococcus amylolentus CBS 6273 TaxID=1296118 RepID=A0A1E3KA98_9TREE|nr:hypothetical protein I350_02792 [Cryptococcus amylolentus CBS 6273]